MKNSKSLSKIAQESEDWAAIEEHVRRQDEVMVKGFDDDINTILIFAGLFSAVLTAFIIESYQWLQGAPPSPEASSTPSSSTYVAINILWFMSLFLSLVSALFGMIAKQWLREYIAWTSESASPRDLNQLRHLRLMAWKEWRVPGIIGGIPALLEIALVLFSSGIIILLWTLDTVVASVLSVTVAGMIIPAFTTTILPAMVPRCPYRSPTGWGIILLQKNIRRIPSLFVPVLRFLGLRTDQQVFRKPSSFSWRSRDLAVYDVKPADLYKTWLAGGAWHLGKDDEEVVAYIADVMKMEVLLQSLVSVASNTRDQRLLQKTWNCTSRVHEPNIAPKDRDLGAAIHAVCRVSGIDPSMLSECSKLWYISEHTGRVPVYVCRSFQRDVLSSPDGQLLLARMRYVPPEMLEVLSQFLFNDVRAFLHDLATPPTPSKRTATRPVLYGVDKFPALVDIFTFFACSLYSHADDHSPRFPSVAFKLLCDVLSKLAMVTFRSNDFVRRYPGFQIMLRDLLGEFSTFEIRSLPNDPFQYKIDCIPLNIAHQPSTYANLAKFSYFEMYKEDSDHYSPLFTDETHAFVVFCSRAMEASSATMQTVLPETFHDMFFAMAFHMRIVLRRQLNNGGCHIDFPWIEGLLGLLPDNKSDQEKAKILEWVPPHLICGMGTCIQLGLFSGSSVSKSFERLEDIYKRLSQSPLRDARGYLFAQPPDGAFPVFSGVNFAAISPAISVNNARSLTSQFSDLPPADIVTTTGDTDDRPSRALTSSPVQYNFPFRHDTVDSFMSQSTSETNMVISAPHTATTMTNLQYNYSVTSSQDNPLPAIAVHPPHGLEVFEQRPYYTEHESAPAPLVPFYHPPIPAQYVPSLEVQTVITGDGVDVPNSDVSADHPPDNGRLLDAVYPDQDGTLDQDPSSAPPGSGVPHIADHADIPSYGVPPRDYDLDVAPRTSIPSADYRFPHSANSSATGPPDVGISARLKFIEDFKFPAEPPSTNHRPDGRFPQIPEDEPLEFSSEAGPPEDAPRSPRQMSGEGLLRAPENRRPSVDLPALTRELHKLLLSQPYEQHGGPGTDPLSSTGEQNSHIMSTNARGTQSRSRSLEVQFSHPSGERLTVTATESEQASQSSSQKNTRPPPILRNKHVQFASNQAHTSALKAPKLGGPSHQRYTPFMAHLPRREVPERPTPPPLTETAQRAMESRFQPLRIMPNTQAASSPFTERLPQRYVQPSIPTTEANRDYDIRVPSTPAMQQVGTHQDPTRPPHSTSPLAQSSNPQATFPSTPVAGPSFSGASGSAYVDRPVRDNQAEFLGAGPSQSVGSSALHQPPDQRATAGQANPLQTPTPQTPGIEQQPDWTVAGQQLPSPVSSIHTLPQNESSASSGTRLSSCK